MVDSLTLFKLLADDTRLAIILLLVKEPELCVCEFIAVLELSQPKISRHLAMLREAQLVSTRKSGKWVHYSLNTNLAPQIDEILKQAAQLEEDQLKVLEQKLQIMGDRPQRISQCC